MKREVHITDMGLPPFVVDKLHENEIITVRDLVFRTEQELLKFRGFGRVTMGIIRTKLDEMGLSLGIMSESEAEQRMLYHLRHYELERKKLGALRKLYGGNNEESLGFIPALRNYFKTILGDCEESESARQAWVKVEEAAKEKGLT